ncbi:universal stress protein [Gordonia sp. TBRC 11910]|uniref:Universal stress protein n=1 Tax=Gordonia asplenii TaxID=2725283 RepID=A0A848L0R4_9ACTN|nr:universal stress protein [Gordonia asplenii]NMO04484.1 universal stress protein [Gordonia asplenii]
MNIVIGYDAHENSRAALVFGASLARMLHSQIRVVHVVDIGDLPLDPDEPEYEIEIGEHLEEHRRIVAELLGRDADDWSYATGHGNTAHILAREAESCDAAMIVVGRPHHGVGAMLEHALSGAVSRKLMNRSTFPIVVVPEGQPPLAVPGTRS